MMRHKKEAELWWFHVPKSASTFYSTFSFTLVPLLLALIMAESTTATTTATTTPPATLTPPVLPSHVKKPNEEEHKKALAEVNARIDKLQKQMVRTIRACPSSSVATGLLTVFIGCCQGKDQQVAGQIWQYSSRRASCTTRWTSWKASRDQKGQTSCLWTIGCFEWIDSQKGKHDIHWVVRCILYDVDLGWQHQGSSIQSALQDCCWSGCTYQVKRNTIHIRYQVI